ncbi:MAG: zinc-binding dehydrogenase [Chthoniobacterales bacterium]|nr:zinc-binding dehydrogenase [Chthoniobacterales bacterium]
MKTIAAILVESKKPLVIDEVEVPKLRFGQVLVDIQVTRICGSQIGEIDAVKGPDRFLPHLLGHEAGGVVLEVGPEVNYVRPGDRVVVHWRVGNGLEAGGTSYLWNGKKVNAGNVTTFQKFSVVSENRVTRVPDDTSFDLCALLADTITTGFGVINNDAKVKIGESVVVVGCGGIGLGVVLGASLAGAFPIIAVDLDDSKLQVAKRYGANYGISSKEKDFLSASKEILEGFADVVVDCTGRPEILEKAFELTSPQGRCIGVGVMPFDHRLCINTLPLHFGKILTGSHGGSSKPAKDIPRYLKMIRAGKFEISGFVSHKLPFEQINQGIELMRKGKVVHCLLYFN